MCLTSIGKHVRKFLVDNAGKEYVTCYKVVRCKDAVKKILIGPVRAYPYSYKPGINQAYDSYNSPVKKFGSRYNTRSIDFGIHVYTSRKKAQRYTSGAHFVVPVKCKLKDLLGINLLDKHAVFTKVELSQRNYNRAMNTGYFI